MGDCIEVTNLQHLTEQAITLLRKNGRASYTELAAHLGTNRAVIASLIRPLFENGTLRVLAAIHPGLLGIEILAHLSIRATGDIQPIIDEISKQSAAVFISETTGRYQLVVEYHLPDMTSLLRVQRDIRAMPNVVEVETILYEEMVTSFFHNTSLKVSRESLDQYDFRIMAELQLNGRVSYSELASRVNLSTSATRARVLRLLNAGAVQIGVVRGRNSAGPELVFGLGMVLKQPQKEVIPLLLNLPGIEFLASTVGRFDLVATVAFTRLDDFNTLVTRLRRHPEVLIVEEWLHAQIHLESYVHGTHGAGIP